jgi:stage V sporulation protein D (sporulation-specific penicillin-binding protein)
MYERKINNSHNFNITSGKHWRIYALVFFVFAAAFIIIIRLYSIQVSAHDKYKLIAENQHKIFQELTPKRGEIYLQDEKELYPLAINQELQMVYLVPKEVEDKDKTISSLSVALNLESDFLRGKLTDPEDMFEILKHKLTNEEILKIKELNLPGVHLTPENFRYYPAGELASQLVGFVGSDGNVYKGRYGLELYWDKELRGVEGNLNQEKDAGGRWISIADRELKPAKDGENLILTINHTVQYEVEKILKETIEKHGADNGTIIAMEPKTGRILAMANYPNFNPNDYSKVEDMNVFGNLSVDLPYECGSVFKTITIASGIDVGKIEPDTTYSDTGSVISAGYEIKNSDEKSYGTQTMIQVLEKSLNTGAIFVEKLVGNKNFADYVERFGFGKKTNIELPGELGGNISNLKNTRSDIQFFTASFGQGITVTPIQLLNAYAAIANKGRLMKPQIVDRIVYSDGREEKIEPEEIRQVVTEETAAKVGQMLRSVVTDGHGKRANVPGYLIAGKTGTAQVAKSGSKGYEEGITIGSFVGYAPLNDPKFAVLVKINNPKDVQWAESSAAPAFSQIMKLLLDYYKVKPTEENEIK